MTFTPGSDEGRTDTYEAQKKLQEDDQTAEEQFDEAQQGLRDANTFFQRFWDPSRPDFRTLIL